MFKKKAFNRFFTNKYTLAAFIKNISDVESRKNESSLLLSLF